MRRFAHAIANAAAQPVALTLAFVAVGAWFVGGFFVSHGFQNTNYQLLINTGTTIVTFWLGFAILVSAARVEKAMMLKLDELVAAMPQADDQFIDLEDKDEKTLSDLKAQMKAQFETPAPKTTRKKTAQ